MPHADPVVKKEYHRQYWANLSEAQKIANRERNLLYARANKAKRKAHYESRKAFYVTYERNRQYQKMYGITIADYDRLFALQNGKCGICGGDQPYSKSGRMKHFSVDHCHTTGKVRGLLCNSCNVALGRYEGQRAGIDAYLERSK